MASQVQGGWVLSSRLGFGFLTCSGGCSIGVSCSFLSLALWLRWLHGLLNLTHFGRSWMKSVGRWLPLRDILSEDKGVGWLVLQIKSRPLIALCCGGVLWMCQS